MKLIPGKLYKINQTIFFSNKKSKIFRKEYPAKSFLLFFEFKDNEYRFLDGNSDLFIIPAKVIGSKSWYWLDETNE